MNKIQKVVALLLFCVIGISLSACAFQSEKNKIPTSSTPITLDEAISEISNITSSEDNIASRTVEMKYIKPTKLNKDSFDFTFSADGDLYSLPVPISEFFTNGWIVSDSKTRFSAAETSTERISLVRGDREIIVDLTSSHPSRSGIPNTT